MGLRCTKQIIAMLGDQRVDTNSLHRWKVIIAAETRCILGGGDIAKGAVQAFQAGVLDVPFAPSRFNAGKVLPARDNDGAIRFFGAGALPYVARYALIASDYAIKLITIRYPKNVDRLSG
jgi:methylaspartate mutase epsilon subunit